MSRRRNHPPLLQAPPKPVLPTPMMRVLQNRNQHLQEFQRIREKIAAENPTMDLISLERKIQLECISYMSAQLDHATMMDEIRIWMQSEVFCPKFTKQEASAMSTLFRWYYRSRKDLPLSEKQCYGTIALQCDGCARDGILILPAHRIMTFRWVLEEYGKQLHETMNTHNINLDTLVSAVNKIDEAEEEAKKTMPERFRRVCDIQDRAPEEETENGK